MDHAYFVYQNGGVFTDVPVCEIEMQAGGFAVIAGFIAYDALYAVGIITEDGCEVLWKAGDL